MSRSVFVSKRSEFNGKNRAFKDMLLGHMAMDIEVFIKDGTAGTPVKSGDMKAETRHFKNRTNSWRVESGKEYSAVQEAGIRLTGKGAPTRRFRNYTTPGTSAGWFARAIDMVNRNKESYIQEARRGVGL